MASEISATSSEFAIVEKLGGERLRLLLDIAAELSGHTAGVPVSIGDLAFDDRVAEAEMGKGRVRDALVLFHALGLIELDEAAKTFQAAERLIEGAHARPEGRLQQLARAPE